MIIKVTPNKCETYLNMVFKSMSFFKANHFTNIFAYEDKCYFTIHNKEIVINITEETDEAIQKVKDYLEYMFNNEYIGLNKEGYDKIKLQNVETVEI